MPRYDYKCEKNGHVFEVVQGFHDEPGAICPIDGSQAERQLSVPHVIYKGSGFYTTDYKNSGSGSASDSTSGGATSSNGSKSESSSSSSSESKKKSDTKSESKTSGSSSGSD